ncbi:hypothetical protein D3C85_1718780 [compost metagenome]
MGIVILIKRNLIIVMLGTIDIYFLVILNILTHVNPSFFSGTFLIRTTSLCLVKCPEG